MYARTAQEGFYVAGGGIPGARAYSHYTALLIKAALEGLISSRPSTPHVEQENAPAPRNLTELHHA
jgi:putative flavoprotein involved in K+ transport